MAVYLSNAFSLQMLAPNTEAVSSHVTIEHVRAMCTGAHQTLRAQSVVGHADIARIIGRELSATVPQNRASITLAPGDILIVGQYVGGRLPEGATELPEGAKIRWFRVSVWTGRKNLERLQECRMIRRRSTKPLVAAVTQSSIDN